jgi:transcriptional regulator GlxA family with amidase domain
VHRVVALVVPHVVAFDLSIVGQVFGLEPERYAFEVCTERPGAVASTTGYAIHVERGLDALEDADTVVVPGFRPLDDPPPAVLEALRAAADRGTRIASVCVGAFALAAAGLLDGRAATTHWQEADAFRDRFPGVRLDPDVLYVDEGQVLTSAGISAGIDLCLYLVGRDHGAAVAAEVARRMVVAVHRPGGQAQYRRGPLVGEDELRSTLDWAVGQLHRPLSVEELARHAHVSPRTLARRFREEIGVPPMQWLTGQRLLEAQRLLASTRLGVDEIAERCGLGSAGNLRLHLARTLGTTPTAYRRSYRASPPGNTVATCEL